jgi:predicted ChrR family anti-sigma factor
MFDTQTLPGVLSDPAIRKGLKWEAFREGVDVSWIYRSEEDDGPAAAFLRYSPGASVPEHTHTGYEHIFVLEGEQSDENGRYKAGSLTINSPGASHTVKSQSGCVVIAVWEKPVRFAET